MRNRGWEKFRTILSREVVIEYKACLYFAWEVFFYFAYLLSRGIYMASMAILFEMILTAYGAGYIQVYLFHNSDERSGWSVRIYWGLFSARSFMEESPARWHGLTEVFWQRCCFSSI